MYILLLILSVNTRPLLSDLKEYFTPQYAADWKEIGIMLDVDAAILAVIERDYYPSATDCSNAMLNKWLKVDNTASWGKLLTIVESPPISIASDKGDYIVVYISSQIINNFKLGCQGWFISKYITFSRLKLYVHINQRQLYVIYVYKKLFSTYLLSNIYTYVW